MSVSVEGEHADSCMLSRTIGAGLLFVKPYSEGAAGTDDDLRRRPGWFAPTRDGFSAANRW